MSEVEVDEVLRLCKTGWSVSVESPWYLGALTMGYKATKVAPDNAVPRRPFALIELLEWSAIAL
jgi:hypothetical protein